MKSNGLNTTPSTSWGNRLSGTGLCLHQISQFCLFCRTWGLVRCRKMQFSFSLFLSLFLPVNLIPLGSWDLLLVGDCNTFASPLPSLWLPKHSLPSPRITESHIPHSAHKDMSSPPPLCLGKPRRQHYHIPLGRHARGWMNTIDTGIFLVPEILPVFAALIYNHHTVMTLIHHLCPVPIQRLKSYLPLNLEQ